MDILTPQWGSLGQGVGWPWNVAGKRWEAEEALQLEEHQRQRGVKSTTWVNGNVEGGAETELGTHFEQS